MSRKDSSHYQATKDAQRQYWRALLSRTDSDVREAAKIAGVHRQSAYRILADLGIPRPTQPHRGNWAGL